MKPRDKQLTGLALFTVCMTVIIVGLATVKMREKPIDLNSVKEQWQVDATNKWLGATNTNTN